MSCTSAPNKCLVTRMNAGGLLHYCRVLCFYVNKVVDVRLSLCLSSPDLMLVCVFLYLSVSLFLCVCVCVFLFLLLLCLLVLFLQKQGTPPDKSGIEGGSNTHSRFTIQVLFSVGFTRLHALPVPVLLCILLTVIVVLCAKC